MKKVISTIIILLIIGCGGGGSSGGSSSSFTSSGSEPVLNTNMVEKSYTVEEGNLYVTQFQATDNSKVIYFIDGEDDKFFYINSGNGKLSFRNRPDFEKKKTYNLIVIARDIVGNETNNSVVINIKNIDEEDKDMSAPIFISDTTFTITKNSEIRILTSDSSDVTYSLKGMGSSDFNFDSSTGIIRPQNLSLSTYSFTIEAKDKSGNRSIQKITINIEKEDEILISPSINQNEVDRSNPVFTSNDSITVQLSTQLDYSSAPNILEIRTIDDSSVTYSLGGEDRNSLFLVDNSLYFSEIAIPLQKNLYTIVVYAKDIYGNQSSQSIKINIDNDMLDTIATSFLSPSTVSVPFSEQSDYATAPSILTIETNEPATFFIEGEDASEVYLSTDEEDKTIVFFTSNAIPLKKAVYNFTLVATDEAGNESRQNVTINIIGYENNVVEPTPTPMPASTSLTFLSPSTVSVPFSEQSDYATAPSILTIETNEPATFFIEGEDASEVYLSTDEEDKTIVFFTSNAIPLKKAVYNFTLVATDEYANVLSRQNITINISDYPNEGVAESTPSPIPTPTPNYENIEDIPPTFLSSNSNTVSYLNQTDYATAPSILDFKTDKPSYFSIEGTDASYVYISILEENTDHGVIFFTEEAIPLTKDSYSFTLVATDEYGNVSRQNITINISDYPNEGVGTPTPAHIDISGYWKNESEKSYIHYNDDGTMIVYDYDEEQSCYLDNSVSYNYIWINDFSIKEIGTAGIERVENFFMERRDDMLIKTTETGTFSFYYYQIPPDIFYSITVCN